MQNLKQRDLDVATYTEEFHKYTLCCGYMEEEKAKVARYLNGLRFKIQDEISLLTLETVEKCFQVALRAKEKLKRKGEQQSRGRGGRNFRGGDSFEDRN